MLEIVQDFQQKFSGFRVAPASSIKAFDLKKVHRNLAKDPGLMDLRLGKGMNLLQFCCWRQSFGSRAAADRQLALAKWLVSQGFDPRGTRPPRPGGGGAQEGPRLSLGSVSVGASRDHGASWTSGTPVAGSSPVADRPWLVGGPAGTLHMTYQDVQSALPSAIWYTSSSTR